MYLLWVLTVGRKDTTELIFQDLVTSSMQWSCQYHLQCRYVKAIICLSNEKAVMQVILFVLKSLSDYCIYTLLGPRDLTDPRNVVLVFKEGMNQWKINSDCIVPVEILEQEMRKREGFRDGCLPLGWLSECNMLLFNKGEVEFWWKSELNKNLVLNILDLSFPLDIQVEILGKHLNK